MTLCVWSKQPCTIKTIICNDIFTSVRHKKLQSPAKNFKVQLKSSKSSQKVRETVQSGLLLLYTELTLFCFELPENCIYLNQSELRIFFLYPIRMIMYMKKLCASDWLKMNAFSCNTSAKLSHKCKLQVAWVHFQNFICHDSLCCFSVYNINK